KFERSGKYLLFSYTGDISMVSHYRMDESYYTVPAGTEPGKHELVTFHLDKGVDLFYRDTRKFGRMNVVPNDQVMTVAGLATIGPEPTESDLTIDYMISEFGKSKMHVKPFLLNQNHIAGLGNIYVDETLWQSKIHPLTAANQLTVEELTILRKNIIAELARETEHHGTTVQSFPNDFGKIGRASCRE